MDEALYRKLRVVREGDTHVVLREYIEVDQIPVEYGGTLKYGEDEHSCRFTSPFEVALREHVESVLEED
eukprot:29308-Eustigmatos_ZCMA.PRE.1